MVRQKKPNKMRGAMKMFSMCARRCGLLPVGTVQFHLHASLPPQEIADKNGKVNGSERGDAFCWV